MSKNINNNVDSQYLKLLEHILNNGRERNDRTGTGTIGVFDYSMRFNLEEGFPILTSKKVHLKAVIHELLWFLNGDTNIKYLVDNNVNIWNGDAYKNYITKNPDNEITITEFINNIKTNEDFCKKWGELGVIYGAQWRNWNGTHDQITNLIDNLKNNPYDRRHIVMAWNVSEIENMVLPPCHFGFQCYVEEMTLMERKKRWVKSIDKSIYYAEDLEHADLDIMGVPRNRLSLKWFQRSVDVFLGLPFNITSYGILLTMLAMETNMFVGDLIFNGGDVHIYKNHKEAVKTQMHRNIHNLPILEINNFTSIFDVKYDDIKLIDYISEDIIKAPLSN